MICRHRCAGLYQIINVTNGHLYFGSTVNFYNRSREHRLELRSGTHHCGHLQNAWRIYGEEAFEFRVVALLERSELHSTESRWLALHVDHERCYNSGVDADAPMRGRKHSAETRAKMSRAGKGKKRSAEWRAAMSAGMKGRIFTPEHRAKITAACSTPERIERTRQIHCGRTRSEEARLKMSEAAKRRWTPEARAAFGDAFRGEKHHWHGRRHSAETIAKMSAARRRAWATDGYRQKVLAAKAS